MTVEKLHTSLSGPNFGETLTEGDRSGLSRSAFLRVRRVRRVSRTAGKADATFIYCENPGARNSRVNRLTGVKRGRYIFPPISVEIADARAVSANLLISLDDQRHVHVCTRVEKVRVKYSSTYGTESHDLQQPDGEGEIEDYDDHEGQHEGVEASFPPTVDA